MGTWMSCYREAIRGISEVDADDVQVGRVAADYFIEKGYENFAYVGTPAAWSAKRQSGFVARIGEVVGVEVPWRQHKANTGPGSVGWERPPLGGNVSGWLAALPRPAALLAGNDVRGRELAEWFLDAHIRAPDDVAILGVDNDDLDCELTHPPLSSVHIPWRQAGYRAAALLEELIDKGDLPPVQHLIEPTGVIERQSTDIVAIADSDDEIRRVHVECAKRLLISTDLAMPDIADKSGFTNAVWFSKTFRQLTG